MKSDKYLSILVINTYCAWYNYDIEQIAVEGRSSNLQEVEFGLSWGGAGK
jgi:hypothetical protein